MSNNVIKSALANKAKACLMQCPLSCTAAQMWSLNRLYEKDAQAQLLAAAEKMELGLQHLKSLPENEVDISNLSKLENAIQHVSASSSRSCR
jgi:hypothetical protein